MGVLIEMLECEDMTLFNDIDHYILHCSTCHVTIWLEQVFS